MTSIAMNTAATGMMAMDMKIAVIANNIANLSTTAYKRQRPEFDDLLYQTQIRPGTNLDDQNSIASTGIQVGLGVKLSDVYRIQEQGELLETGNPYDLAIQGKGFFRIIMPDGSFSYTRDGSLGLSATSEIVTPDGYVVSPGLVIPQGVPADGVTINKNGQVYVLVPPGIQPQLLGQLDMVDFPNPAGLSAEGGNLFVETAASGTPIIGVANVNNMGSLLQGWLETSNTNPITELTEMMVAQRGYDMCSKVLQTADQMENTLNQVKG